MSWRRLIYDVLRTSALRRLENVQFTTSWRHPIYIVLKTSNLRRLGDVQFTLSWRLPIYEVLETSDLRRLEDVWFKTSWRRLINVVLRTFKITTSSRRLIYVVLKTSNLRRLQDVCKTTSVGQVMSMQRRKKWFFLILYCLKYSENFKCSCLGYYLAINFCKLLRIFNPSWRRSLSIDWFLYDRDLEHERVNHT